MSEFEGRTKRLIGRAVPELVKVGASLARKDQMVQAALADIVGEAEAQRLIELPGIGREGTAPSNSDPNGPRSSLSCGAGSTRADVPSGTTSSGRGGSTMGCGDRFGSARFVVFASILPSSRAGRRGARVGRGSHRPGSGPRRRHATFRPGSREHQDPWGQAARACSE